MSYSNHDWGEEPTVILPRYRTMRVTDDVHIHVTPTNAHPISEIQKGDVMVSRHLCIECLEPFCTETLL